MKKKTTNNLLKRNIVTVLILIITTMMGIYVYQHIYFDSSFNAFVNRENESMKALEEIAVKFGDAHMILLLIDLEEENLSDNLKDVKQLVSDLKGLPFVNAVDSIFDAQKFDGFTLSAPFVRTSPYIAVENGVYTIDTDILEDDFYVGTVISDDGGTLAVSIRKSAEYENDPLEITEKLIAIIDTHIDLDYYLIGEDIVDFEIFTSIQQLTFVYPPIILLAVFGIFMIKFRNFYLSLLTVISPVLASVWIYFLMLFFDKSINSLTVMVSSFLIIIGSAYGMHFLTRFLENNRETGNKIDLIIKTILEEKTPIYFSAMTTMAGFISYVFLKMQAFRDMGLFISIGILLCAFFTLKLIPTLLIFSKDTHKLVMKQRHHHLQLPRWFKRTFSLFVILLIIATPFLIVNIPLDINSYDYFKETSTIKQSIHHLEEKFHWVSNFYLMIEQKEATQFTPSPEDVDKLIEISHRLDETSVVTKNMNLFGLAESMNMSSNLLLPIIKNTRQGREYGGSFYSQNSIRYMLFVNSNDSKTAKILLDTIHEILDDYPELQERYNFFATGIPLIWLELSDAVVENQLNSLMLSFVLIFILLLLIFRKIKTALLSAIPIALTILFNFAFMGLFQIALEIPTAIISGMLMGLVIDYAIHFMYWYKKKGNVTAAYEMTASPIIFNGISLIACFVVLLTAPLMLYVRLALLMILGIAMGVLTTLVFLPQILERLHRR